MTKERLEELIKQRASIWYDGHFEIKLNPEQYSIEKSFGETVLWYQPKDEPSGYDWSWGLDVLREDVDRAKWEHDIFERRTERFEPPMWEDIKREDRYIFRFVVNNEFIYFDVNKDEDIDFDSIIIFNTTRNKYIFNKWSNDATKENYEKACEIVRDLFNGGSNGKNA